MTVVGADTAQLRDLSRQMEAAAERLDRLRSSLRSRLHSSPWQGRDAAACRSAWDSQHGPRLLLVAGELRQAAHELVVHADEQDRASSVTGDVPHRGDATRGPRPAPGPAGNAWDRAQQGAWNVVRGFLDATAEPRAALGVFPGLGAWFELDRLGAVRSPALGWFQGTFLDGPSRLVSGVSAIGTIISAVELGTTISAAARAGDWVEVGLGSAEVVASVLKTTKNPVVYAIGVGTQSLVEVGRAGAEVDWDEFPETLTWFNPTRPEFREYVVPSFLDALTEVPTRAARMAF